MRKLQQILLVGMFLFGALAFADLKEPIPYPGKPIEPGDPIEKCEPSPDPEVTHTVKKALKHAGQKVQCGQYSSALELMEHAYEGISYLEEQSNNRFAKGWCFSKKNCSRPLVAPRLVTKKHCKGTGIAESWIQQSPSVGSCENL